MGEADKLDIADVLKLETAHEHIFSFFQQHDVWTDLYKSSDKTRYNGLSYANDTLKSCLILLKGSKASYFYDFKTNFKDVPQTYDLLNTEKYNESLKKYHEYLKDGSPLKFSKDELESLWFGSFEASVTEAGAPVIKVTYPDGDSEILVELKKGETSFSNKDLLKLLFVFENFCAMAEDGKRWKKWEGFKLKEEHAKYLAATNPLIRCDEDLTAIANILLNQKSGNDWPDDEVITRPIIISNLRNLFEKVAYEINSKDCSARVEEEKGDISLKIEKREEFPFPKHFISTFSEKGDAGNQVRIAYSVDSEEDAKGWRKMACVLTNQQPCLSGKDRKEFFSQIITYVEEARGVQFTYKDGNLVPTLKIKANKKPCSDIRL